MKDPREGTCFGMYAGTARRECASCVAARRCKAVLVSDGFDVLAELLDSLFAELPAVKYRDTVRVVELVDQLLKPPATESLKEEEELLGVIGQVELDGLSLETI